MSIVKDPYLSSKSIDKPEPISESESEKKHTDAVGRTVRLIYRPACELSDMARTVLVVLSKYVPFWEPDYVVYPGIDRLAGEIGKSRRTITRALGELDTAGLIRRVHRSNTSTIYHLVYLEESSVKAVEVLPSANEPVGGAEEPPPKAKHWYDEQMEGKFDWETVLPSANEPTSGAEEPPPKAVSTSPKKTTARKTGHLALPGEEDDASWRVTQLVLKGGYTQDGETLKGQNIHTLNQCLLNASYTHLEASLYIEDTLSNLIKSSEKPQSGKELYELIKSGSRDWLRRHRTINEVGF